MAGLLAALFGLPRPLFAVLVALLAGGGAREWARLCGLRGARGLLFAAGVVAAFAVLFLAGPAAERYAFGIAAIFWVLLVPPWLASGMANARSGALLVAGFAVLVPASLAMATLEPRRLLAVLVLVWVADSAAYFVGRALGRRKLAPSISPGKTWEGAAGGVAAALVWAIICRRVFEDAAWTPYLAAAAILAAASIVGDLFESAAKRRAGVKDSGALLPGHGGILDRIDSATA
ncbi:MAG TPA: phosphatidate cytidylyltransferase, partial [Burkholderiales bacterium]|nr:phosphatidate cytidylyltransferase [Burkholderiales bacterium]